MQEDAPALPDIVVRERLCVGKFVVDTVDINEVAHFKVLRSRSSRTTYSMQWLVGAMGLSSLKHFENMLKSKNFPKDNVIAEITDSLLAKRGKHHKYTRKVGTDGVPTDTFALEVRGYTFNTANTKTIHIECTKANLEWFLKELRADMARIVGGIDAIGDDPDPEAMETNLTQKLDHAESASSDNECTTESVLEDMSFFQTRGRRWLR